MYFHFSPTSKEVKMKIFKVGKAVSSIYVLPVKLIYLNNQKA